MKIKQATLDELDCPDDIYDLIFETRMSGSYCIIGDYCISIYPSEPRFIKKKSFEIRFDFHKVEWIIDGRRFWIDWYVPKVLWGMNISED